MKNKVLMGLIATATIGTAIATPAIINGQNTTKVVNKVLMVNNKSNSSTNEAVVINGNSKMSLYALSNGSGIVSNLSTGEMLTILGQAQNGYCKVKVQETGAIGYISVANMQNILNGTNDTFTQLSGNGQVINVSSNVRIRSNPAIGNNIIGHLTNGTILNILGKQGQWYKINVNGQTGFIYEEYVSTNITSNSQSVTNNVNINSGNTNISSTNVSNSNSSSNVNSNKHVKNVAVRTKSSATSNVNEVSNSNKTKNNSQSKIINKTKSLGSSQVTNNSNIGTSSQKNNIANGKKIESFATFSLATINKNCSLYDATPNCSGAEPSLKLSKGQTIFILNNDPNYPVYKGWVLARTALGEGYLPITDFTVSSQIKYRLAVINKECTLFSSPNKNANPVILQIPKNSSNLPYGTQVFVSIDNNNPKGWLLIFVPSSTTAFAHGYIQTNNLVFTSRVTQQG